MRATAPAAQLLHELADKAAMTVMCRPDKTPGRFISRLPEEQRKVLRELRSEDIADVRVEDYWG